MNFMKILKRGRGKSFVACHRSSWIMRMKRKLKSSCQRRGAASLKASREVQRKRLLECLEKRLSDLSLQLDAEKILLTMATQSCIEDVLYSI